MNSSYHRLFAVMFLLSVISIAAAPTARGQIAEDVVTWLRDRHCKIGARLNQYDRDRFNLLVNQAKFPLGGAPVQRAFLDSLWEIQATATHVEDHPDAIDFQIVFKCVAGSVAQASVSVDLDFSEWSQSNYVLLPAAAYNGNRYPSRRMPYPPRLQFPQDIGPGKPIIISDVPKLDEAGGPSRIQERSGSLSTPSIGFRSASTRQGFWLLTKYGNELGDYGLSIEENRKRDRAVISVTSPVVREVYTYRAGDAHFPSQDTPKDFKGGDALNIVMRVYGFEAPEVQSLFDKFVRVRKDFATLLPAPNTLPYSACFKLLETKFNAENFVPQHGYYSVGAREDSTPDWQIGRNGGMISTYPLLVAGSAETRANVVRNFDWLFRGGIAPSGFFQDSCSEGTHWNGGDIRQPGTADWHLIRKSGDGLYYIVKQFMLMEKIGIPVKPEWKVGTQKVCDAFVAVWKKNHQFGQFVSSTSGEIKVGGSASGAIVPAALCLAAEYFHRPEYLAVAQESADDLFNRFTLNGITTGGPDDALQSFDSESAYALVESYTTLFESTADKRWLLRAQDAAKQFATWVVSDDYSFPRPSLFSKAMIHTRGAVFANIQDKHASPGVCTYSGTALLKLYRATGDHFYLELLSDIAHNLPQYLPHPRRPIGNLAVGHIDDRVNTSDWEGPERIGESGGRSTWAETALMLTTVDLPGIYVRPEKSLCMSFDNIDAKIATESTTSLTLQISNPTAVAASVTMLVEYDSDIGKPLGGSILAWPRTVMLNPGEAKLIEVSKVK